MKISTIYIIFVSAFFYPLMAHDKWIVVTTIQYPTPQLIKLAQMPGWRLVVVGDLKTPSDWYLENCDYLSPQKQLSLGYKIADLLPWNHYSRKNVGYLYAIAHGALLIYDTDDDNEPIASLDPLVDTKMIPVLESDELSINIYHYFGQPHCWPRGYPLEKINDSSSYRVSSGFVDGEIGIEQGLVNDDPDVDAVFRLTQSQRIFFSPHTCLLSLKTFCPFNSQNTFIHKKAFFTLYLPSSVSMRVADIWRSYYAQKLMHLYHLYVAFSGPSALQIRNNHNLMDDYILEQDLYLKSMELLRFLAQWNIGDLSSPFETMKSLIGDLVEEKFFTQKELVLCQAWLDDLQSLGYH